MKLRITQLLTILLLVSIAVYAGDDKKKDKNPHEFKMIHEVETTPVISQDRTGTCWSFATTSFVETELIRMGKNVDLSEMFTVRMRYPFKANNYVRYHGKEQFGPGGQAHDVISVIKEFGFVPNEVYNGMVYGQKKHNHGELGEVLKGFVDGVVKNKSKGLTPVWKYAYEKIIDTYLGTPPSEFEYEGEKYTPVSFRDAMGFNPCDYVEITSYTHHPFYEKFVLEVNDNFSRDYYYNVPIDDLVKIMDNALENGYSVCYDADVSSKNFKSKDGYGIYVDEDAELKAEDDDDEDPQPEEETVVTQEMRQKAFDNYRATDDHLMHITGLAENQEGTKFYYTKNSWGIKSKGKERKYKGFWYLSEQHIRMYTIAIMVHKDAIPADIRTKLGL